MMNKNLGVDSDEYAIDGKTLVFDGDKTVYMKDLEFAKRRKFEFQYHNQCERVAKILLPILKKYHKEKHNE